MTCTPFLKCVLIALLFSSSAATGQTTECCDPKGPFVLGEAFPEIPATCTSLPDWIDRAPDINARISFSIVGVLEEVHEEEGGRPEDLLGAGVIVHVLVELQHRREEVVNRHGVWSRYVIELIWDRMVECGLYYLLSLSLSVLGFGFGFWVWVLGESLNGCH